MPLSLWEIALVVVVILLIPVGIYFNRARRGIAEKVPIFQLPDNYPIGQELKLEEINPYLKPMLFSSIYPINNSREYYSYRATAMEVVFIRCSIGWTVFSRHAFLPSARPPQTHRHGDVELGLATAAVSATALTANEVLDDINDIAEAAAGGDPEAIVALEQITTITGETADTLSDVCNVAPSIVQSHYESNDNCNSNTTDPTDW